MGKKAAFHSLGCKVNSYETDAMCQLLKDAGYEIVPFEPGADVYVINTCSVTNIADRKSRQMLHRAKKMNPNAVVVATGCYVETASNPVSDDPAVDLVLPNNHKNDLVKVLEAFENDRNSTDDIFCPQEQNPCYEPLSISRTERHVRADIKIQDGCNQFCSYCIIPYARGRARSRPVNDVLCEVKELADNGTKEIVLTGIHLSSYGSDIGTTLLDLICEVHEIPGIERIRLGSLEPNIVTDSFAKELSSLPKFCPHFHLSLQSGSDSVLKRMNRHYTAAEYEEKCSILRNWFQNPAITTDVIVGFPQETEEEFNETVSFLKRISLYETHIFKYSLREGTRAASMSGQVPEDIKNKRSQELIALGDVNRSAFEKTASGHPCEVLFEEKTMVGGTEYYTGYTREYIRTAIPSAEDLTNRILDGKLGQMLEPHLFLFEND